MTTNQILLEILAEIQKLTDPNTGVLALFDQGMRGLFGAFIAFVVIYAVDSWFRK